MTIRRFMLIPATVGVIIASAALASPAGAATLNVCEHGCRYSQIGPALAAAHSGDTVRVGPDTYHGGLTIDVSLRLVGAGPRSTIISGGGSVLTIGTFGAATEPTVSIDGVTITKGVARSSPESVPFVGQTGVVALGGGVEIPANADFSGGATVTITNSVITGNRVAPVKALRLGPPCPGTVSGRGHVSRGVESQVGGDHHHGAVASRHTEPLIGATNPQDLRVLTCVVGVHHDQQDPIRGLPGRQRHLDVKHALRKLRTRHNTSRRYSAAPGQRTVTAQDRCGRRMRRGRRRASGGAWRCGNRRSDR